MQVPASVKQLGPNTGDSQRISRLTVVVDVNMCVCVCVCVWRGYLAISIGQELCGGLDLPPPAGHLCGCNVFGTAKGPDAPRALSKMMKWEAVGEASSGTAEQS